MNILNNPLLTGFAAVVLGSCLLLLGAEHPKTCRLASLALALVAVLFAVLAFGRMAADFSGAFGVFLAASIALGNFAAVLLRIGRRRTSSASAEIPR